MSQAIARAKQFVASEDGPTGIEYAVLLVLIIVVCLFAVTNLGQTVETMFVNIDGMLPIGASS